MSMFETPLRQRCWHSPRIEDRTGQALALAVDIPQAKLIIQRINTHAALLSSLEELLPIAARAIQGTTDGEPMLARAREAIAKAKAQLEP